MKFIFVQAAPVVVFVLLFLRVIYRLTLHPLARCRGPKLASMTHWWLYFQERSRSVESILEDLHQKYGTRVLRIGPNELHISNPFIYDEIYSAKQRFLKEPHFYAGFNSLHTVFSENSPAAHRERRKLMNPCFSKQAIAGTQTLLNRRFDLLISKILAFKSQGPIHIYSAIRCATVDIISEYSFGESFGLVQRAEDNKFKPDFLSAFDLALDSKLHWTYFPYIRDFCLSLPRWIAVKLEKGVENWWYLHDAINRTRVNFKKASAEGKKFEVPTIFEPLVGLNDALMIAEAFNVIVAGSDTTAATLGVLMYKILVDTEISRKLVAELDTALPDKKTNFDLSKLERLDYLTACIKEGLRYALALPGRLPRIVPEPSSGEAPFIVDGIVIPPGTVVGISATSVHFSKDIWGSDVNDFRPERWLHPNAQRLDKFLVPFSKGARQCLGINLVYAELRIALAKLFRNLDFSLDETTTETDIRQIDCFTAGFKGTGPRIHVKGERP